MTKTLSEYVEGLSHETLVQCIREYERWYQGGFFVEDSKLIQCAKEYYEVGYDGSEIHAVIREIQRRCAQMWVGSLCINHSPSEHPQSSPKSPKQSSTIDTMVERMCHCGKKFLAKKADIQRGWANSCSKSCAAIVRERKTGNYKRYIEGAYRKNDEGYGYEFSDAHLFSNEEHDCNED